MSLKQQENTEVVALVEYVYNNKSTCPDMKTHDSGDNLISGIHYDVANSSMTDKSLVWCRWDEDNETITLYFTNTLSQSDKDILDTIMGSY